MIKSVYAIRDVKTNWLDPFIEVSDDAAIRGFKYALSNGDGLFGFSPEDFTLYKVGTFDTASGAITGSLPAFVFDGAFVRSVDNA